MPKDKERTLNPAAAQRKQEKAKALKKSKAEALTRRNEKLARRNPDRIQRQINELKSVEESGQSLRPREKQILEALERDLRAVQKAREDLGDKAPKFENARGGGAMRGRGDGVLGKRRRDDGFGRYGSESDGSETDEEVRKIPMPRDTPPPIPKEYQKRRGDMESRGPHPLPAKPVVESKTVYESAPDIRNLRQEAVSKFVPTAVRAKQQSIKGQGKLLEPEEMDELEKAGYMASAGKPAAEADTAQDPDTEADEKTLAEEERRFNEELKRAHAEEVEDEEA
ncbi:hypothetical protein PHISCL_04833 [Aspergillus sclerotialis]|uniref:Wbp11/ELF5/Saf1 N-terminal domain-containing protein n=1 Tax=Aspergillus sclerotialis TaxID=2070753 RepID=A0A3A2ZN66_9EURO|nr:hypothetical protein PHISCL_04833 [Aspergillus sclerotialis]